jgi:hypothetical protein
MRIMELVIELDELACGAAKRKVVCRSWERKKCGQRGGRVEIRSDKAIPLKRKRVKQRTNKNLGEP